MNHISDPPEYELASTEGTAQVVVSLSNVAQRSHQQQPGKDQVERGWSTSGAESESLVFVDQKRRPAPRPRPLVVRAEEGIAQRGDETDG